MMCVMSSLVSVDVLNVCCWSVLCSGKVLCLSLSKFQSTVSINTCIKWLEFHSYTWRPCYLRAELIFHSNNVKSCNKASKASLFSEVKIV